MVAERRREALRIEDMQVALRPFLALAAAAVVGGLAAWTFASLAQVARPAAEPRPVAARGPLTEDEKANIAVFQAVSPSTVHITTVERARDFLTFNVFEVPRGTGSGFVWDDRGHIVTNFHVIQGASGARVTLADQSEWRAELVGVFPDRDLAVLRIPAPREKLRPIPLGTSRDLQVGQKVYAIGNPFGLDQTLTIGIVSALGREIESVTQRKIRGVIQTDAAINPGNSGGALVDSRGHLVGINTAIYSQSGGSMGIGFAIPVSLARNVMEQIIRTGTVIRGWIGVEVQDLTSELAESFGVPAGQGALIAGVMRNAPADRAGIRPGDVLLSIDGQPVKDAQAMLDMIAALAPGSQARFGLNRSGRPVEAMVTIGRRPRPNR